MSYATTLYAIDIERLQATFASHDTNLLTEIMQKYATEIANSDESFTSESAAGATTVESALQEIIAGEITQPDYGFQYGYALEYICRHLGIELRSRFLLGIFNDLYKLELNTLLAESRLPIPIPEADDFPFISYMTFEKVIEELQRLEGMDLSYPDDVEIEEERHDFRDCLKIAKEAQCGIVSFYC